jgi:hypothetical protein
MHAQIALVDLVRTEFGIVPAGIFGHSAGEVLCLFCIWQGLNKY